MSIINDRLGNASWQLKVLRGLSNIADNIVAADNDYEAKIVRATSCSNSALNGLYLEVRIFDATTGVFAPPVYYKSGTNTTVLLPTPCAIEYVSDAAVLALILTELEAIQTGTAAALGQTDMDNSVPVVMASDQSDIDVILKGPIGVKPVAESVPVTIASDEGAIPVSGSVSATIAGPLGQEDEAASIPVVIASDQTGAVRTPEIERVTNASNVAAGAYSVSFANVHASANSFVKTVILKPGETITFDAGAVNNTLAAIAYVATGSELLIIKIT